ncbi:MAG: hypothetical protein F6K47_25830 [Symploca sp. SIO2E6]|nr:hypothetical protein [Symploca sp. SIO2E6]
MPTATYESVSSTPSLIISVIEDGSLLVSFDVTEATQGKIMHSGHKAYALCCEIRGQTYSFTREHLDILSSSERKILYDWLKVDGSELNWDLV